MLVLTKLARYIAWPLISDGMRFESKSVFYYIINHNKIGIYRDEYLPSVVYLYIGSAIYRFINNLTDIQIYLGSEVEYKPRYEYHREKSKVYFTIYISPKQDEGYDFYGYCYDLKRKHANLYIVKNDDDLYNQTEMSYNYMNPTNIKFKYFQSDNCMSKFDLLYSLNMKYETNRITEITLKRDNKKMKYIRY
jgi:hypothetical protein